MTHLIGNVLLSTIDLAWMVTKSQRVLGIWQRDTIDSDYLNHRIERYLIAGRGDKKSVAEQSSDVTALF